MIQKETEEKSVFEEIPTQKIYSEKAIRNKLKPYSTYVCNRFKK